MKFIKSFVFSIAMLALLFAGPAFGIDYTVKHKAGSSIDSIVDFSGAGQNDINVTGTYKGDRNRCYEVVVTATSTFKWRANCSSGDYTTGVSMTTTATEIENGIKLHWDTATGHTATDSWKFKVFAVNPFKVSDSSGKNLFNIENDNEINLFNSSVTSNNTFYGMKSEDSTGSSYIKMNREFVMNSATYTITAKESGRWFTSDTGSTAYAYTLPPAAVGLKFGFIVRGSGLLSIIEAGGDTITCGASSTGVSATSSTADDYMEILGVGADDWVCISVGPTVGDWTYN